MPWKGESPMDQRTQFIADFLRDALSITELCALVSDVSRKTGYKWIDRYLRQGAAGLEERSRLARRLPNQTPREIVNAILAATLRRQETPRVAPQAPSAVVAPRTVDSPRYQQRVLQLEVRMNHDPGRRYAFQSPLRASTM